MIRLVVRVAGFAMLLGITACAAAPASLPTAATPTTLATQTATATAPAATTAATTAATPTAAATPTPTAAPASSAPPVIQSGNVTVEIGDNFYLPELVIVTAGTRVLWVNRGQMTHTASARDESFDSGNLEFGQSYTRVFAVLGRYTYYCVQHEDMIGIVEVR